ncbi:exodeoxyribonuclease VII large subunit [Thalassotalea ponticola]|uniref:exodeoxyribonuclease VII large subunit n=1 Tax=Thalassotalea ponticola TaxID=1523392 RepID=UPI0025B4CE37|nr:exodeoxyribonuclease VII large subunit [Thalassotalea ponticola]MDN3652068.1 exodeoxyribonuclease VII large subunit [Thalassotalea ponticola]
MFNTQKQHILKVSELTKKARFLLESELSVVWLSGEISNFIAASSGHWYLSLKDAKSQVRCAMFKGNNRTVQIRPANGKQVLVKARVSLYEPRGDFQLIIEQMTDAGEGLLQQKYEQLKAQLQAEGLFDHGYKQPLPSHINTVGVVTSPTGAAIHDILHVLQRRNPSIEVIIYPTLVQGEGSAQQIADAIYTAYERDEVDALIVGRGGGSLEDLWSFNEEIVVRAIFDCDIPIVSAVGHEVDTCLSDFVADMRAPTPSAAAELLSNDKAVQIRQFQTLTQQAQLRFESTLHRLRHALHQYQHRLSRLNPIAQLRLQQQHADELRGRLLQSLKDKYQYQQHVLTLVAQRLQHASPARNMASARVKQVDLTHALKSAMLRHQDSKHMRLSMLAQNLNVVSPLATIARGYSIARDASGKIIRRVDEVTMGDVISVQVSDGELKAQICDKSNGHSQLASRT